MTAITDQSPRAERRRHRRVLSGDLLAGCLLLLPVVIAAYLAPLLAPYDPYAVDTGSRLLPPSAKHLFGTDELGRDLLTRVLYGTRASLSVAFGIVAIGTVFGTVVGTLSGYLGGRIDGVAMRLNDIVMAIPFMVIALALTSAMGPSLVNLTIVIGILSIPFYARMARGMALALRREPYVTAAWLMGASTPAIIRRHVIPNMLSPMLVLASMGLSGAILTSSALSFIGLGAQPPAAELGAIINSSRSYILDEWWYTLFPGLVLAVCAFGFNLIGDGVRDVLDPNIGGSA